MPDNSQGTATPPATSGGFTIDAVNEAIAKALGPVAEVLKGLQNAHKETAEALTKLTTPATVDAAAAAPKPVTEAAVAKIVADSLGQFQQAQALTAARTSFAGSKMADLPETYRNLLPNTADLAALAAAEQTIRARYQAEVGSRIPAAAVSSAAGGGAAQAVLDVTKMTPAQLIEHGIKNGMAVTAPASNNAAGVAAAAAAAAAGGAAK